MPRIPSRVILWCVLAALVTLPVPPATAQNTDGITPLCPPVGIQPRPAQFEPGGIILTYFDRFNLWVYRVATGRRYPLPETAPCGTNCHLSRDARWITYLNAQDNSFGKMRLDGTQRTHLADYASEVEWWDEDTLLVWTPGHDAYLRDEGSDQIFPLDVRSVTSVQPGGLWAVMVNAEGEGFARWLVNLEDRTETMRLGADLAYFNAADWSPDGSLLAYVATGDYDPVAGRRGGEIYAVRPGDPAPMRLTRLADSYGAARLNGHASGKLSWSPDGTRIAFWVTELLGPDPTADLGAAMIHVLDLRSDTVTAYCGFTTTEHTPNPPRLVWSPGGTHLAFGGNVPGDDKGYLLLALDLASGVFTELSDGIYPALGSADVIAWGLPPQ